MLTVARRRFGLHSFLQSSLNLFANKILILCFRLERALHLQLTKVGNRRRVSPGLESLHQLGIAAVWNEVKQRSRGSAKK